MKTVPRMNDSVMGPSVYLGVSLQPRASPANPKLLQKDFISYLMSELRVSKPPAFKALNKLQAKGLVWIDSSHPRQTAVTLDLVAMVKSIQDVKSTEEPFEPRASGLFGEWPDYDEQRLVWKNLGLIEYDEEMEQWRFTDSTLSEYRTVKKEFTDHSPAKAHAGAILKLLIEKVGSLTPREMVYVLLLASNTQPFYDIEILKVHRLGIRYDDDPVLDIDAKKKLFESIGEEYKEDFNEVELTREHWKKLFPTDPA